MQKLKQFIVASQAEERIHKILYFLLQEVSKNLKSLKSLF